MSHFKNILGHITEAITQKYLGNGFVLFSILQTQTGACGCIICFCLFLFLQKSFAHFLSMLGKGMCESLLGGQWNLSEGLAWSLTGRTEKELWDLYASLQIWEEWLERAQSSASTEDGHEGCGSPKNTGKIPARITVLLQGNTWLERC